AMLFAPVFVRDTPPLALVELKLFPALVRAILNAPVVKLATPVPVVMVVPAICVMSPLTLPVPAVTLKAPAWLAVIDTLPRHKAMVVLMVILLAPVFVSDTQPVKTLAIDKVMAKLPVVNDDVPGTVKTPVWVIAPPAVTFRLPLIVVNGKEMAELG